MAEASSATTFVPPWTAAVLEPTRRRPAPTVRYSRTLALRAADGALKRTRIPLRLALARLTRPRPRRILATGPEERPRADAESVTPSVRCVLVALWSGFPATIVIRSEPLRRTA